MSRFPMIAVPVYDGKTHFQFNRSLMDSFYDMTTNGLMFAVEYLPGCCYIDMARNELVHKFLNNKQYTDLFFIDADVGWEPQAIRKVLEADGDIVAAPYRYKADEEKYPFFPLENAEPRSDGLIPAKMLATGFMRIRREAVETFMRHYPQRIVRKLHEDGRSEWVPQLFANEVDETGLWWGEDLRFCNLARGCGLGLFIYPGLTLTHTGLKEFAGVYTCKS